MGSEAFAVNLDTRWSACGEAGIDEPSNIALEQTAGSRSLAAAAHRGRSPHWRSDEGAPAATVDEDRGRRGDPGRG